MDEFISGINIEMTWLSDQTKGVTENQLWNETYGEHLQRLLTRKKIIDEQVKQMKKKKK